MNPTEAPSAYLRQKTLTTTGPTVSNLMLSEQVPPPIPEDTMSFISSRRDIRKRKRRASPSPELQPLLRRQHCDNIAFLHVTNNSNDLPDSPNLPDVSPPFHSSWNPTPRTTLCPPIPCLPLTFSSDGHQDSPTFLQHITQGNQKLLHLHAVTLQSAWRGFLAFSRFQSNLMRIVLVQNQFRRRTAVSIVSQLRQAQAPPLQPARLLGKRAYTDRELHSDDSSPSSIPSVSLFRSPPQHHRRRRHRRHQTIPAQRLLPFHAIPSGLPPNAIPPDQPYGDGMEPNADGVFRLAYDNIDGFHTVPFNNPKANFLKDWLRSVEADFFAGNEPQINWSMMPRSGRLPELFRSENALRTIAAYNTHENFSRRQYGGTFQLTFGELAARVVDTGVDERQLGRYAWTKFQGRHGHVTRIISVYVPCKTHRSSGTLTIINQHRRYFEAQGMTDCPRSILLADIQHLLSQWRQDGDRVIAFIDANENMLGGPFHAMFTAPELQMREVVSSQHPDPRWLNTASYSRGQFLGKWPIDGVYATPDLPFDAATWLAFMPHLGDHHFAVVDIKAQALVGDELIQIARPQA